MYVYVEIYLSIDASIYLCSYLFDLIICHAITRQTCLRKSACNILSAFLHLLSSPHFPSFESSKKTTFLSNTSINLSQTATSTCCKLLQGHKDQQNNKTPPPTKHHNTLTNAFRALHKNTNHLQPSLTTNKKHLTQNKKTTCSLFPPNKETAPNVTHVRRLTSGSLRPT